MDTATTIERIQRIASKFDTQKAFAAAIDWSESRVSRALSDTTNGSRRLRELRFAVEGLELPDGTVVDQSLEIAPAAHIDYENVKNAAEMFAAMKARMEGEVTSDPTRPYHVVEDIIEYPYRLLGDRAEAGSGADNTHPDPEYEALVRSQAEVRRYTGLPASRLKAFFVVGNSMTPEIQPNTAALYLPTERVEGAGMYILTLDDLTVVKVVDVLAGGALVLSSKNKTDFPRDEILLPLKESDTAGMYRSEETGLSCTVKVEGRVVMYTKAT